MESTSAGFGCTCACGCPCVDKYGIVHGNELPHCDDCGFVCHFRCPTDPAPCPASHSKPIKSVASASASATAN